MSMDVQNLCSTFTNGASHAEDLKTMVTSALDVAKLEEIYVKTRNLEKAVEDAFEISTSLENEIRDTNG